MIQTWIFFYTLLYESICLSRSSSLGYDLLTEINKFLGELELFLHSRFKLKDFDPLKYFTWFRVWVPTPFFAASFSNFNILPINRH